MRKTKVSVPGHISGFFQPFIDPDNISRSGSRNCGLCIDAGVTTEVELEDGGSGDLEIFIDGQRSRAETSRAAVTGAIEKSRDTLSIKIRHSVEAPIGAGYGMSAAGALGAVMGISEALGLDLGREEVISIAHEAEVSCNSGLGDVGPEMIGGLVLGAEAGAPPYGRWKRIGLEVELEVVCGSIGPLPTGDFLENKARRMKAEKLGASSMEKMLEKRTIENFMKISREFAEELDIFDDEFYEILKDISSRSPLGASAVMLGRAIFAPARPEEVEGLERVFLEHFDQDSVMITPVDPVGARL